MCHASSMPHPPPHRGLPRGRAWRSAPRGARGLWGDGPLLRGLLPGSREPLPCARSSSCADLGARGAVLSHLSLSCPSCCCTVILPSLKSALPEHTQHCSWLSLASDRGHPCSFPTGTAFPCKPSTDVSQKHSGKNGDSWMWASSDTVLLCYLWHCLKFFIICTIVVIFAALWRLFSRHLVGINNPITRISLFSLGASGS